MCSINSKCIGGPHGVRSCRGRGGVGAEIRLAQDDIGSEFSCFLQLTEDAVYSNSSDVYYEFDAMITRTGVEVRPDQTINCAIDFVTTGEIKLLIGEPSGYILKEEG